jgi:hypothetical protein
MRLGQLICFCVLLTAWSCPQHTLNNGYYRLIPTEIISDDCQFWSGPVAFDANLQITGDTLQMELGLLNATFLLYGTYEENIENFYADGQAAQLDASIRSQPCTVESVNIHLTAVTDFSQSFHGTIRATLQTIGSSACNCIVSLNYRAVRG